MLKEIRKLRKEKPAQYQYIWALMRSGKIGQYISPKGYLAYETQELKEYKKTVKIGRPIKEKGE